MKLSDDEIREISQKVAESISNYILSQIASKHLYVLDVHVDLRCPNDDEKYILDIFVHIDVNPFCKRNIEKLINNAVEKGLSVAREELRKYGILEES